MSKFRDLISKVALVLGAAGLLVAGAAVLLLPRRTVQLITTPNAPDIVEMNRAMWSKGEPVAPIYGTPIDKPMEIHFAEDARIIVPPEDPSLTLYTVDKAKGENPLQAQTVKFLGRYVLIGSGVLLLAGILHFVVKRKRASKLQ